MIKAALRPLLVIAFFALAAACEKDTDEDLPPNSSWLEVLEQHGKFDLFASAVRKSGLADEVSGTAYTLFAPADSVFQAYLNAIGTADIDAWLNLIGDDLAKTILSYHIIHGPGIDTSEFITSFINTRAQNKYGNQISLHISCDAQIVRLNSYADIISTPLEAGNLIIHEIDQVLYLPKVVDLVAHDPEFSLLRQSLQIAGSSLDALLRQENEKFCFFAPTNKGFQNFINASANFNDFKGFSQYHTSMEIRDILLFHMLPVVKRSEEFTNGTYGTRLPGQSLNLVKDNHGRISILDPHGNQADVILTDIHALNGIVHSVNYVLLPH